MPIVYCKPTYFRPSLICLFQTSWTLLVLWILFIQSSPTYETKQRNELYTLCRVPRWWLILVQGVTWSVSSTIWVWFPPPIKKIWSPYSSLASDGKPVTGLPASHGSLFRRSGPAFNCRYHVSVTESIKTHIPRAYAERPQRPTDRLRHVKKSNISKQCCQR